MLFNQTPETEVTPIYPAVTFPFNWVGESYFMDKGTPVEVTGIEAVKAWLQLVLRTSQGRYAIYPTDFGASLYDIIGQKLPKGASLSELRRQLKESAVYCNAIVDIGPVTYDGERVTCTITLDSNITEVVVVEP